MRRPDLRAYTAAIADRLPANWTASTHVTGSQEPSDPLEDIWDEGHFCWAISDFVLNGIGFLDGPDGVRLAVVSRPLRRCDFIVGALHPPGFPDRLWPTVDVPNGIVTGADPARAAAAIDRRLLPAYAAAIHELRLVTVTGALEQARQDVHAWNALAPYYTSTRRTTDDPYEDLHLVRVPFDAKAWLHFTTFLVHGQPLIDQAFRDAPRVARTPGQAARWRRELAYLHSAWKGGLEIHRTAAAQPTASVAAPDTARYADLGVRAQTHITSWLVHGHVVNDIAVRAAAPEHPHEPASRRSAWQLRGQGSGSVPRDEAPPRPYVSGSASGLTRH